MSISNTMLTLMNLMSSFDIFFFYLDGRGDDFRDDDAALGHYRGGSGGGNNIRGHCCCQNKFGLILACPPLLKLGHRNDELPIRMKPYPPLLCRRHCSRHICRRATRRMDDKENDVLKRGKMDRRKERPRQCRYDALYRFH